MTQKNLVMLEVEDGREVEVEVMFGFDVNDRQYVAMMTTEVMENEERDIYIHRFYPDGSIEMIDDSDEYDAVVEEFERLVDDWCDE